MKSLFCCLITLIFLFPNAAFTQEELSFKDTIIIENSSKDDLFLRSLLWFKQQYSKPKIGLLETADAKNGVLTGYSRVLFKQEVKLANRLSDGIIEYDIYIEIQENRCIYSLYNFSHYGNIKSEIPYDYGDILDDEMCMNNPPEVQLGNIEKAICEHIFTTIQATIKLKIDALTKDLMLPYPQYFSKRDHGYIAEDSIAFGDKSKEELFDACANWMIEAYGSAPDSMQIFDPYLGHVAKSVSMPYKSKSFLNKGCKGVMKYYLSIQLQDDYIKIIASDFTHQADLQKGLQQVHLGYIMEDEKCVDLEVLSSKYISRTCKETKEIIKKEIHGISKDLKKFIAQ